MTAQGVVELITVMQAYREVRFAMWATRTGDSCDWRRCIGFWDQELDIMGVQGE